MTMQMQLHLRKVFRDSVISSIIAVRGILVIFAGPRSRALFVEPFPVGGFANDKLAEVLAQTGYRSQSKRPAESTALWMVLL
jgi:hypothetical protein